MAYVYVDDGISCAEFARRPGFVRLMAALTPRLPLPMLIMSKESRWAVIARDRVRAQAPPGRRRAHVLLLETASAGVSSRSVGRKFVIDLRADRHGPEWNRRLA